MTEQEFTSLYETNRDAVLNIVRKYEHNKQSQEDLVQDIFLRAWESLPKFEGGASIKTWLHSIATNHAKNHVRDQGRRVPTEGSKVADLEDVLLGNNNPNERVTSTRPLEDHDTPEDVMIAVDMAENVRDALEDMPKGLAHALLLRMDGYSHKQIAEEMECSEALSKMRVSRARDRLTTILAMGGK